MKLKVILASVSLAFGFSLLVLTSVMIQRHIYDVEFDMKIISIFPPDILLYPARLSKYTRCNPNESPNDVSKKKECKNKNDNYDGVLATFALALIASLCHIAAFIWAAIKSDDWVPWAGIHIGALVFTLISFVLGLVYKVQQHQYDVFKNYGGRVIDRTPASVWLNEFADRQGLYWGMVFLAITALDSIFCIAAVVVGFMK